MEDQRKEGKAWEHSWREWRQVETKVLGERDCDVGGGAQPLKQWTTRLSIQTLYHSFGVQTLAWSNYSSWLARNSVSSLVHTYWPLLPYVQLTRWMLPGLLRFSLVSTLLWTQTEDRNGEDLGTRIPFCYFWICLYLLPSQYTICLSCCSTKADLQNFSNRCHHNTSHFGKQ